MPPVFANKMRNKEVTFYAEKAMLRRLSLSLALRVRAKQSLCFPQEQCEAPSVVVEPMHELILMTEDDDPNLESPFSQSQLCCFIVVIHSDMSSQIPLIETLVFW